MVFQELVVVGVELTSIPLKAQQVVEVEMESFMFFMILN
jgi:hypothetical protein